MRKEIGSEEEEKEEEDEIKSGRVGSAKWIPLQKFPNTCSFFPFSVYTLKGHFQTNLPSMIPPFPLHPCTNFLPPN